MTPPLVLRTAARWATQRTRGWGHGVRAIHRSRQRLSAIGADDGAAARPSAADAGLSLHRYVIGRSVTAAYGGMTVICARFPMTRASAASLLERLTGSPRRPGLAGLEGSSAPAPGRS